MLRKNLESLVNDPRFERAIVALIILNAVTLGLETSQAVMERFGSVLHIIDRILLSLFVLEIAARLMADFRGFWRDPWKAHRPARRIPRRPPTRELHPMQSPGGSV